MNQYKANTQIERRSRDGKGKKEGEREFVFFSGQRPETSKGRQDKGKGRLKEEKQKRMGWDFVITQG